MRPMSSPSASPIAGGAIDPQKLAHYAARHDFELFLHLVFNLLNPSSVLQNSWYISAMAKVLTDVAGGELRRLLISVPPRHLKSITTNVAFPAWLLGRDPEKRILCASYGQELSGAHTRNFRRLIRSKLYAAIFPETASMIVRDTDVEIATRRNGFRYSTAVNGTVTGLGADVFIVDDVLKAQEAVHPEARERVKRFLDETVLSRLENKATGSIISIQQRLHEDDAAGYLLEKGRYHHLELPAIAVRDEVIPLTQGRVHRRRIGDVLNPGRESRELLEDYRREMGVRTFEAQYQQNPTPPESAYVRWDKIYFYDERPARNEIFKVVMSWDVAHSIENNADYSVGTIWGHDGESWLLLDLIRDRFTYTDLLARVRAERKRWRCDLIIVEDSSVGPALLDQLSRDLRRQSEPQHHATYCGRLRALPRMSKEERLFSQVEGLYSGLARLPREASWLEGLRKEMLTFPAAKHDDQVDSVSQFLHWAGSTRARALLNPDARPLGNIRPA
jgi:predicted phage terminase large subunit-like protein